MICMYLHIHNNQINRVNPYYFQGWPSYLYCQKNNKQQTTTIPNSELIMVYLRVAIILSLALHCNSLIINVVAQLRDGIRNGRPNSGWALENIGSAVSIAIEDFQAKGLLTEHTFR